MIGKTAVNKSALNIKKMPGVEKPKSGKKKVGKATTQW